MDLDTGSTRVGPYSLREWRIGALVFLAFVVTYLIRARVLPDTNIELATGVAIVGIFFGGIRLWPIVFLSSILGSLIFGESFTLALIGAAATLLQALSGGYLLAQWKVDPIFRRDRDALFLIGTLFLVSFFAPLYLAFRSAITHEVVPPENWIYTYVAAFFSLIVVTPFLMRWSAKPWFNRTTKEIAEIFGVFVLLIMINAIYFIEGTPAIFGLPVIYLLLIPFFFISLRLRPRFVTLAVVMTALFAMRNFVLTVEEPGLPYRMFMTELLVIILAITFFIITALEEHRRSSANRFYSQVATLKNAMARLSSESQAKNDFIAILAHELRNPLTPIVSGIELLKIRGQDEEGTTVLDSMNASMHVIKTLLNDLLDVSRISEGKITLKKRRINIEPVLGKAITSTEHHRKERHQYLSFTPPKKPLFILGDAVRIEQVFSNLLTNASKYSDEGDTITVRAQASDDSLIIEVLDQGVGIRSDALEAIFEPFHQIEQGERSKEGLGIGLSLVHDFVKMHGGTVKAESEGLGKGSKFIVRLPLDKS